MSSFSGNAIFFLSTGRCGTQWLGKAMAAAFGDVAVVTHEPLRGVYAPKHHLRSEERGALLSSDDFSKHLAFIRETLQSKSYVETGWPCYPALPFFIDQFRERIRIVHLVRHPVPVALSLATHNVYAERTDWVAGAAITPFDEGVVQKELAERWGAMGAYEKCLFWWTEINLYALELAERHRDVEFHFVRFEELFDPATPALEELVRFMKLGEPSQPLQSLREERVDRYRWKTADAVDWKLIFNYPRTVALAQQLGYDVEDCSSDEMAARYFER